MKTTWNGSRRHSNINWYEVSVLRNLALFWGNVCGWLNCGNISCRVNASLIKILKCLCSLFFARTNAISRETLSTYFVFSIRLQVVGSQARILYSDQRGRVALAQAFNKGISEGRLQVSRVFLTEVQFYSLHSGTSTINLLLHYTKSHHASAVKRVQASLD